MQDPEALPGFSLFFFFGLSCPPHGEVGVRPRALTQLACLVRSVLASPGITTNHSIPSITQAPHKVNNPPPQASCETSCLARCKLHGACRLDTSGVSSGLHNESSSSTKHESKNQLDKFYLTKTLAAPFPALACALCPWHPRSFRATVSAANGFWGTILSHVQ